MESFFLLLFFFFFFNYFLFCGKKFKIEISAGNLFLRLFCSSRGTWTWKEMWYFSKYISLTDLHCWLLVDISNDSENDEYKYLFDLHADVLFCKNKNEILPCLLWHQITTCWNYLTSNTTSGRQNLKRELGKIPSLGHESPGQRNELVLWGGPLFLKSNTERFSKQSPVRRAKENISRKQWDCGAN